MNIKSFYLKNRFWILLLVVLLILTLILFLPMLFLPSVRYIFTNTEEIKRIILSYGNWSIFVYVVIGMVCIISPIIPNEVVPLVGGMIFGFWTALLWALVTRIIGSTINYWIGTKIRKGMFLKLINDEDKKKLKNYTEKIGWQVVLASRLISSFDADLIAYAAGMAQMAYIPFICVSFLGMLIPVVGVIFAGATLLKSRLPLMIGLGIYAIVIFFSPLIWKRLSKRKHS